MAKTRTKPNSKSEPKAQPAKKRSYVNQSDVPIFSLQDALRVPQAICDELGKRPSKPLRVAQAMELAPASGHFRKMCGAAVAYGLTEGGYNAETIQLTELGRRVAAPMEEGDEERAKREASLRPRVPREFLEKYRDSKLPREHIARNVLEEMGVPNDRLEGTFELIKRNAELVGMLHEVKGNTYVDLDAVINDIRGESPDEKDPATPAAPKEPVKAEEATPPSGREQAHVVQAAVAENRRVFITHGKNRRLVEPLKDLFSFGDYEPVVSVERESVSKPVPDKVMDDMRSCTAAIIHVDKEQELIDTDGDRHTVLNPNVLIEIGAAMALYGRRFILLVREGLSLPSNLQGLYQVRYQDDVLDAEATIRVLKALKDIKNHFLPTFASGRAESEK